MGQRGPQSVHKQVGHRIKRMYLNGEPVLHEMLAERVGGHFDNWISSAESEEGRVEDFVSFSRSHTGKHGCFPTRHPHNITKMLYAVVTVRIKDWE